MILDELNNFMMNLSFFHDREMVCSIMSFSCFLAHLTLFYNRDPKLIENTFVSIFLVFYGAQNRQGLNFHMPELNSKNATFVFSS